MTNVLFTEVATDNLISQALYIYEKTLDIDKSDNYLITMKSFIKDTLSRFPKIGRSSEEFGTGLRKLVYKDYSILYRIEKEYILIITIYKENLPSI